MRVLYLALERLVPGGAADTHVGEIVAGLRARGIDVELCAERGDTRERGVARVKRYGRVLKRSAAAMGNADVAYIRSHFAALPFCVEADLRGLPVVHEVNGPYGDAFVTHAALRPASRVLAAVQRWQYRKAAHLVAVTPGLATWAAAEAGHDRVTAIGNAANTALFRPDGPVAARARPYALFFGGLTRWHGVETMVAALASSHWPAGIDLCVAGPVVDPGLAPLLDAAPPGLVRLGPLPQADLPALIRGAIATLVPITDPNGRSSTGVLPLKLFEGLGCGTPAIVSDLPGQADLVRDAGCGLVVPVGDGPALAGAVAALAADPDRARAMGAAGAERVRLRHSWDAAAGETAAILKDVVERRRAAISPAGR